jgi:hypothetical protein
VTQYGAIRGVVTLDGAPVNGAQVSLGDKFAYSDASGHYTITDIAYGNYNVQASITQGMFYFSTAETITISAPSQQHDIALQSTQADFGAVEFDLFLSCDHCDANPAGHKQGVLTEGPIWRSIKVSPWQVTATDSYSYDYNGGGLFNVQYRITVSLAFDLSVNVEINPQIWDDSGNKEIDGTPLLFNVPRDQQVAISITTEADGFSYHNGPCVLVGTVRNLPS